jgi:hypothetical protein
MIIVVLETMWDWRAMTSSAGYAQAPRFFTIHPENFSGRRLHGLLDPHRFLVTNACRELVNHATRHGKPDPVWLAENLASREAKLILLCGAVAHQTYLDCGFEASCPVLVGRHPAARNWTREQLAEARKQIHDRLR